MTKKIEDGGPAFPHMAADGHPDYRLGLTVRDWFAGTPDDDWTSMAVVSDGSYQVPAGLVSSFPVTTKAGNHCIVSDLPLSAFACSKIDVSIDELRAEADAVRGLGFVR